MIHHSPNGEGGAGTIRKWPKQAKAKSDLARKEKEEKLVSPQMQEEEQVSEPPPEDLEALIAETQEEIKAAKKGGGDGGERYRWDPGDPLIPEIRLHLNLEYLVKTAPIIARLFLLYGEGDLSSGHVLSYTNNLTARILVPVKVRDEFVRLLPEQYRRLTLVRSRDDNNRLEGECAYNEGKFPFEDSDLTFTGDADGELKGVDPPFSESKLLTYVPGRFFKLSGTKMESYGRKNSGFYTMDASEVERRWRTNLEEMGYGHILSADPDAFTPDELLEASDVCLIALHCAREDTAPEYYLHQQYWGLRQREKKGEARSLIFNSMERWNHFLHVQRLTERLPQGNQRGPFPDTQTIRDSVDVLLDLEKLGATILDEPRLMYTYGTVGDTRFTRVFFIYQGDFATLSIYALRHMEKTITWRKAFMSVQGATVLALVKEGDPRDLRDKWYFGSVPDLPLSHYTLLSGVVNRRFYQGKLANVPETFRVPDFPRLAGFFFKLGVKVPLSYQYLEETIHRIHNKEVIFREEMWKKYRFVNWPKDWVFWAYVETGGQGVMTPAQYEAASRPAGWELHAVARNTWATYLNFLWAIRQESWLLPQLAEHINNLAEQEGLPVRITYDSPDCNFFRTRETWLEIWRTQPLENIRERVNKEIIEPLVEAGKWLDLRGELVKFFSGLPTWHEGREDITDLFEDYLAFADEAVLSHVIWLTIDGYARNAESGDVKRPLAEGWGVYPTERMAERHPDIKRGRVDRVWEQYSPFTFAGMQKARLALEFLPYDANFVITGIRAIVDKIAFGIQPTVDEVYEDIMANLGNTRRFYPKRVLNALDYIENFFKDKLDPVGKRWGIVIPTSLDGKSETIGGMAIAQEAFKVMRAALEKAISEWEKAPSHKVDLFGALVTRDMFGEVKGEGGWVDAVEGGRLIEEIRSRLPGA